MTKFVEWAALIVAIGLIVAIIVTLPIMDIITQTIGSNYLTTMVGTVVSYTSYYLTQARGFINWLFPSFMIPYVTIVIYYMTFKILLQWSLRILTYAYHWLFKG